jgi:mannosyl-3-phosphoglycerate phosphatase
MKQRKAAKIDRIVIFSDLDGTLLDKYSYSYDDAREALDLLMSKRIPLVFCSAKTRAEQDVYRNELGITDPFIVENGGAIFVPKDYFEFKFKSHRSRDSYDLIELGIPYHEIRRLLIEVRKKGNCCFKGFGDMGVEEVAEITGLDVNLARLAKQREYDETLIFDMAEKEVKSCIKTIKRETGLSCVQGGRFYDAMGPNDKGKAVSIITNLFRKKWGKVKTIGIGDSCNDFPMLNKVDFPILVQKPDKKWEETESKSIHRIEGIGPVGWKNAIHNVIYGVWS